MPGDPGCLICKKQVGQEDPPPGGYIYEGRYFAICHSPRSIGTAGTVIIESRRHFLDFGEMTSVEGADLTGLLRRIFPAIKEATGAERLYSLAMMDGVPHFHLWLVPWRKDEPTGGVAYLASEHQMSSMEEIEETVGKVKQSFYRGQDSLILRRRSPGPRRSHGAANRR